MRETRAERGLMGIPARLLGEDEQVDLSLRPHWKELVRPALVLIVTAAVGSYLAAIAPEGSARDPLRIAILVVGVLVVLIWSAWPFLRWLTTSYVVTNRRLITRYGVISRTGRDMPLARVNDVSFSHGPIERLLRCGTLVVESAGERGQLVLADVPRVEDVQREIYRLVEEDDDRRRRRGPDEQQGGW